MDLAGAGERDFFGGIAASLPDVAARPEAQSADDRGAMHGDMRQKTNVAAASKLAELRRVRIMLLAACRRSLRAERHAYLTHVLHLALTCDWPCCAQAVIGGSVRIQTPYGNRPLVYSDWAASGRALAPIEDTIRDVLRSYGNTHTTTSVTGLQARRSLPLRLSIASHHQLHLPIR